MSKIILQSLTKPAGDMEFKCGLHYIEIVLNIYACHEGPDQAVHPYNHIGVCFGAVYSPVLIFYHSLR